MTDSCSVNVCYIGDKLYAMTETVLMRQIDPESLETIGDQVDIFLNALINTFEAKLSFRAVKRFKVRRSESFDGSSAC